jgi:hypothetical protein
MRAFFWLWIMFLLVCLVTDSASYWLVRDRLGRSLELALDGAIVAGIAEEDLARGRQLSRQGEAQAWARYILWQNMAGPLEQNLSLRFELVQHDDQIWVTGQAAVKAPSLLAGIAGSQNREIVVNKRLGYQGRYK